MIAEDLVNSMIPPLKLTDNLQKALDWMNSFKLNHLPVLDGETFIGIIGEDQLYDSVDKTALISSLDIYMEDAFVKPYQHFYDIMKVASIHDISVVAVVNESNEYLGVVNVKDTLGIFGQMSAMQGPGGILIMRINERDYSLQHISRLIEENNAKVLSLYVSNDDKANDQIKVTVKLNVSELSHVIATLERFNYNVIASFQENDLKQDGNENFGLLLKYLNI